MAVVMNFKGVWDRYFCHHKFEYSNTIFININHIKNYFLNPFIFPEQEREKTPSTN